LVLGTSLESGDLGREGARKEFFLDVSFDGGTLLVLKVLGVTVKSMVSVL